jgi:hypothetical protein
MKHMCKGEKDRAAAHTGVRYVTFVQMSHIWTRVQGGIVFIICVIK